MSEKLKLCPFCGGEAVKRYGPTGPVSRAARVGCPACKINFPVWSKTDSDTLDPEALTEAIAAWNRRTPESEPTHEIEALREAAEKHIGSLDCVESVEVRDHGIEVLTTMAMDRWTWIERKAVYAAERALIDAHPEIDHPLFISQPLSSKDPS